MTSSAFIQYNVESAVLPVDEVVYHRDLYTDIQSAMQKATTYQIEELGKTFVVDRYESNDAAYAFVESVLGRDAAPLNHWTYVNLNSDETKAFYVRIVEEYVK